MQSWYVDDLRFELDDDSINGQERIIVQVGQTQYDSFVIDGGEGVFIIKVDLDSEGHFA